MRALAVVVLIACGDNVIEPPEEVPPPVHDGDVIRRQTLSGVVPIGWKDTARHYTCSLAHPDGDCAQPDADLRFSEESCSLPLALSNTFPVVARDDRFYTVGLPYHGLVYLKTNGSCSLDPVNVDGFLLDPVERRDLLMLRTTVPGTFGGQIYTTSTTTDGSSLITYIGPDTVEEIEVSDATLRRVFRLAPTGIRMFDLSPPRQLPGSLPNLYDAGLDHTCHPAHPPGSPETIACFPNTDVDADLVYQTDQCDDTEIVFTAAPTPGFSIHDTAPDEHGIPFVTDSNRCDPMFPLSGQWFSKQSDGTCTPVEGQRFLCDPTGDFISLKIFDPDA